MLRAYYLVKNNNIRKPLRYQSGNVLVLFVISLLVLLIMASLALDGGHLLLNKGRLQNLVDAAALHAAKEIDQGATRADASAAAVNLLNINLTHSDQSELARAIDLGDTDDNSTAVLTIEYSEFPDPFAVAGTDIDAPYVKVSLSQLSLDNFLANVFSFNKRISATAMAGPSTAIRNCFTNLVPMMVCGSSDTSPFGLIHNSLYVMKIGSNTDSAIGAGNFQLIRLENNSGGADIRTAMAGEENIAKTCFSTGVDNASVPTEPGNSVGPVAQGINTRMGTWNGPVNSIDHPRDENICQGAKVNINDDGSLVAEDIHNAYRAATYVTDNVGTADKSCTSPLTGDIKRTNATAGRRIMNVVIGDCTGESNGANNIDFLGVGCFFLTQSVEQKGQESYVVGEFLFDCPGGGDASLEAADTPGPYKMVLYHVPGSKDS
ncbi:Tad domain-containing protein [Colwellia sp. BRX10-3]|uniref:Tad domain-containing protein n=1 Tax=Colwellia sp. BRX10-3 TaxID=2759844 RepID=UPI0015F63D81|nr:Tad domain-containing protein [Colwellia sp. BRX10-3]MBA6390710.1 Tad domain-containing protein [Colwellia sp. BRX10-3]